MEGELANGKSSEHPLLEVHYYCYGLGWLLLDITLLVIVLTI